jgi:hypothetical protein
MKKLKQGLPNTVVALNGGLGNQLFQIAAGLYFSDRSQLCISYRNGNVRKSHDGAPEVFSLTSSLDVNYLHNEKPSKVVCRVFSIGLALNSIQYSFFVRSFLIDIAKLVLKTSKQYFAYELFVPLGIGFDPKKPSKNRSVISGYFQSYRWASEKRVFSQLHSMKPAEISLELNGYIEASVIEKPLIVHIRLGDYKNEPTIGILSKKYYDAAISQMLSDISFTHIWVFSDDLESARDFIGQYQDIKIKWIPSIDGSSSQTLELMRYGRGYIIGNSTFSWWGAFLRYDQNAKVVAPMPWFKGMESPVDLLPPEWIQISS